MCTKRRILATMKLKPGIVLKVSYQDANHYVQVIKVERKEETLTIQVLAGKTMNIIKTMAKGWHYEKASFDLDEGLLLKIGEAIDKCQPA